MTEEPIVMHSIEAPEKIMQALDYQRLRAIPAPDDTFYQAGQLIEIRSDKEGYEAHDVVDCVITSVLHPPFPGLMKGYCLLSLELRN